MGGKHGAMRAGAVFGAVNNITGEFFEYPPLKNQRTHLTYLSKATPVLWEKHTDSQCTSAEGGTDCFIEVLPPGYALEVRLTPNQTLSLSSSLR